MKPIYLLCLHNVRTGGPEAIHQLSDALIEQGFDARMVYYDWDEIGALERAAPDGAYQFGSRLNPIAEYKHYKVQRSPIATNMGGEVVVLPEPLCHLAPKFDKATVLIWWLSVDNGFNALSKVNLNHLRKPNVWHAAQSEYAGRTTKALGFRTAGTLSDYTAVPGDAWAPLLERDRIVVLNASHKVTADLRALSHAIHDIDSTIVVHFLGGGNSRAAVAELFAKARVYVDLGCFPGKDRMPREAAAMGCAVLVETTGAGLEFGAGARYVSAHDTLGTAREIVRQVNGFSRFAPMLPQEEMRVFFHEAKTVFEELTKETPNG